MKFLRIRLTALLTVLMLLVGAFLWTGVQAFEGESEEVNEWMSEWEDEESEGEEFEEDSEWDEEDQESEEENEWISEWEEENWDNEDEEFEEQEHEEDLEFENSNVRENEESEWDEEEDENIVEEFEGSKVRENEESEWEENENEWDREENDWDEESEWVDEWNENEEDGFEFDEDEGEFLENFDELDDEDYEWVDPVFGDDEEVAELLEEEMDRHGEAMDDIYDEIWETDDEEEFEDLRGELIDEVEEYYDALADIAGDDTAHLLDEPRDDFTWYLSELELSDFEDEPDYDEVYEWVSPFQWMHDDDVADLIDEEIDRHLFVSWSLYDDMWEVDDEDEFEELKSDLIEEVQEYYSNLREYIDEDQRFLLDEEEDLYVSDLFELELTDFEEDNYDAWDEDDYEEGLFENLHEDEEELLDEEFDRHYKVIDGYYDEYYTSDDEDVRAEVKVAMEGEIRQHMDALSRILPDEKSDQLEDELQYYLEDLELLDEYANLEDDIWEDAVFWIDPDWDVIDPVFEKHDVIINELFDQLDEQLSWGQDVTELKNALKTKTEALYVELLPYVQENWGREALELERQDMLNYIDEYERYDDLDGYDYPELRELTDQELADLDRLWEKHDSIMEDYFRDLEEAADDEVKHTQIVGEMLVEIDDVYERFTPYITEDTVQFLESEKQEYKDFIEHEASYMCCWDLT